MRLDTRLRNFIIAAWPEEATRKNVLEVLIMAKEPKHGLVCAMNIEGHGTIEDTIMVITPKKIGYGWPIKTPLWEKA